MMDLTRSGPIFCFGEVLLRLNPPAGTPLADARQLSLHIGGAEANVAAALAQLGRHVQMLTVLPEGPLGDLALGELRRAGIGTASVLRREGRLGLYFLDPGAGVRPSRIRYDRAGSAFALHAEAFDWAELARGASWFHVSGITPAVGEAGAEAARAAVRAMRQAGVPVSFDANYRSALWAGREADAVASFRDMAEGSDLLFAGAHDIARALGPEAGGDMPQARRAAAEAAFDAFPNLRLIASTRREIAPGGAQRLGARLDARDGGLETPSAELGAVVDRIGSGDAFAGAVIDAVLRRQPLETCARLGLAAAALKHGIAGDRWIGSRDDLERFNPETELDVQR
jgi:2-dehydro-3-deoxygluconokinase